MAVLGLVFTKHKVSHKDGWTPYLRHAETVGLRRFAQEDFEHINACEEDEPLFKLVSADVEGIFTCAVGEINPCDIEYLFCTLRQYFLLTGDTIQLRIPNIRGLADVTYKRLLCLAEIYRVNLYFVEDKLSRDHAAYILR